MQRKSKDEPVKHNKKVRFSGMEEEQKVFFLLWNSVFKILNILQLMYLIRK